MISRKEAYQQRTQARLEFIQSRILKLEARRAKMKADVKVRFDQKMDEIRGQYAQTKEKLDELEKATTDAWLVLKSDVDEALNALSEAVDMIAQNMTVRSKE